MAALLLATCPGVRVLATSRGSLGITVRQVGQRRAAPQGEGLAQPDGGPPVIAGGEGGTALRGQPLEAVRVVGVRGDADPVPAGPRLDLGVRVETAP